MIANPMLIKYERRLQEIDESLKQTQSQQSGAAIVMMFAGALVLLLGYNSWLHLIPVWWLALPVAAAVLAARRYSRFGLAADRSLRLKRFYDRGIQRVNGAWHGEGATGDEFNQVDHRYAKDLNLFGEGSLFELLCITRTAIGRRGLATYLMDVPSLDETLARQDAVRELSKRTDLREQAAVLGEFDFSEAKLETFTEWLSGPSLPLSKLLRVAMAISPIAVVGLLLSNLAGLLPWDQTLNLLTPLLAFQAVIGLLFRDRVNQMIEPLRYVAFDTQVIREGLQLLEAQQFQSAKLREIADRVRNSSQKLRNVERLLNALRERNKEWFYLPSLVLMAGTQLCMAIEQWRKDNGDALHGWIEAWAEFEALNALANYAHENPDNPFPEFSSEGACFEATGLGHPMLPDESCVRNDVQFNPKVPFYIVSGSNMAGKSTLLRSIGLNAVLAFAGAPVRAQALRLSPLSVCASLSVVDSLLNGRSKFMAEIDRLRQTLELARSGKPVLFLIDEILSGTNSRDRRAVAEAVVRTLIECGAIGALSTHDLALTEIASAEGLIGTNVHMGARDGGDPLDFDYRLKAGVTEEANGIVIARMAGVPV